MVKKAFYADDIKIAVIGGGTGSFTLLQSLKEKTEAIADWLTWLMMAVRLGNCAMSLVCYRLVIFANVLWH